MKIPPKKPHFFKPIQPGFKNGLKIPMGFLKYLKGHDHIEHAILRRNDKKWQVKLNNQLFEEGWGKFVEEHDLQLGDILVFRHEGNMEFDVSIFDSSHCDREYAEHIQEEETNNVEDISKKFKFKDVRLKTSDVTTPISQIPASTSADANPHFVSTIKPYTIAKAVLYLPMDFVKSNGLLSRSEVILVDEKGRSWSVRLGQTGRHFGIQGGCRQFIKTNGVQVGDTYKFELTNNGTIPIVHFHLMTDLRLKNSNVTTPKSQVAASTSADANPHFISTIKPYSLTKTHLYLPMDYVKSNGLMDRREMIIVDEKQRSWSVQLGRTERHFGIKRGWRQFIKANGVQVGDTYKFELTNNGTIPIVHFHSMTDLRIKKSNVTTPKSQVAASTSADANRHFISTIKPYSLTKTHLYLPMDFVKSNGLMNRREMILVDEKQRLWSVRLGRTEHHFGIKRGWRQFIKANGVQVGDTYKFELTNNGTVPVVHFRRKYTGKNAKYHRSH